MRRGFSRPTLEPIQRPQSVRDAAMYRRPRIDLALALLAASFAVNIAILIAGDTSPGWPLAVAILLGAAAFSLIAERRER